MRLFSLLILGLVILPSLTTCSYTQKITDGPMAIERKQYSEAIPMLQREYRRAKSRREKGQTAALLGLAFDRTGKEEEALTWYKSAYDNGAGTDALRAYADLLKRLERYEEAIQAYEDLGREIGSRFEFRRDIEGANTAIDWLADDRKSYRVERTEFNTRRSDYAPVAYLNQQLVITSDRAEASGDETFNWTGGGFTDLFLVDPRAASVDPFDPSINTQDHEGTPAFSPDFSEMIFVRCTGAKREDAYCALYLSRRQGDGWSTPQLLPFVEQDVNYLHPAFSEDGQTLYFSALSDNGWGGYDIWMVQRGGEGMWTEPQLMPRGINSEGNEQFPFLYHDTLFFASDGLVGMGGLDIFKTYPLENGRWSAARNLKPPINSGADDFGYALTQEVRQGDILTEGYFSSSRPGGKGGDDVYRFQERLLPPPPPRVDTIPIVYRNILDVYVVEKIYADPTNPNSRVMGRRPMANATLQIQVGDQEQQANTNEEGKLSLVLSDDLDYFFRAEEEEYLAAEGRFSSRGLPQDPEAPTQRYELELTLDRVFKNQEITLENIYYDFSEYFIREDAKPTLNELTALLELNPEIRIELGSHTDCRGGDDLNERLSQNRAQAAVEYLISNGINPQRLSARGYGENEPAVDCLCSRCTEEEHQSNRRTTFKIVD
ncbi:MAG: OmpA family protein [Bacteroidota bacterium]